MPNPFKALMNIRREELPLSLLMLSYFFLVITSFWVLKPIKSGLFLEYYDQTGFDIFSWHMTAAQAELIAKILNMFVAIVAVIVFTWLARRFRRQQLTYIFSGFFMVCFIAFSRVIDTPGETTVWTFYLLGDLFSTIMVATFFAFLNDSVTPEAAKRLYGLVGFGGVSGGAFGSTFVRVWVEQMSMSSWLWICFGLAVVIAAVAMLAGRMVMRNPPPQEMKPKEEKPSKRTGSLALEGARLVFRSRYLLSIMSIVVLYEMVSTIMDFQYKTSIGYYLDGSAIRNNIATVAAIMNWIGMGVQLFLTSFIMTRFGLTTALMVLPAMTLMGSAGFLAVPILWTGSFLNIADNSFNNSINQSAKESLYVPTSFDAKYKGKAFIDMFAQRFAKVLAVGLSLGITAVFTDFSTIRWLSIGTTAIVVVWIGIARFAGRKFDELATASGQ